jgi:hypothetical protein
MKKYLYLFVILMTFSSPVFGATVYKWVDKDGVTNFTDDYNKIPPSSRDRVEVEVRENAQQPVVTPTPSQPSLQKGEAKTDIYGHGETYWKEKVRPGKARLKEAEANYERAHRRFMEKAMELSTRKFGSRTQYKTEIIELDRLKDEMVKYGEQLAEVNEGLQKISKEAKEVKADPEWLK